MAPCVEFAFNYNARYPPRENDLPQVAIRTGQAVMVAEIPESALIESARDEEHLALIRTLGLKSVICAPMLMRSRVVGLISFVTAETNRRYTASDLEVAREIARRAAVAIENARLFKNVSESEERFRRVNESLRRTNEELRRANEDLNQFAYSASHDLQEPLRMIAIYTQLTARRCGDSLDSETREFMQYAIDGAQRMEMLLRDLLTYTQAVSIPAEPQETVDSGEALQKALANIRMIIDAAGATIQIGEFPSVRAYPIHLVQLFQNLVGNAIKYRSAAPPVVVVEARPDNEPGRWLFSVRDNGIGIDPKYHQQVFGLFRRLYAARDYPGTGIGLAICQKVVERYGGRIWVESEEGHGSTFFFTLPA
jgi:signal transduction histidine kinase